MSWQAISSRILTARLLHKHGHLTVVVAYAPTEYSTMNSKDEFYITLESIVTSRPPHDQIVVLGNLNAATGADCAGFEGVIGNFDSGCWNDNSLRLLTMCSLLSILQRHTSIGAKYSSSRPEGQTTVAHSRHNFST